MNHVLHIAAIVQIRHDTEGRAYYRRKLAAGKTTLVTGPGADPGGHCGATQESSAADSHPRIDTSDKPLPGPAHPTLRRPAGGRETLTRTAP
jgi:hypothetical protein